MAKQITQQLLTRVDDAHDWNEGQTYGGSGTYMSRKDECRICGLRRRYSRDPQNDNYGEYSFETSDGAQMTLRDVASLSPCVTPPTPSPKPTKISALVDTWIERERSERAKWEQTHDAGNLTVADTIARLRRELQEAAGLVVIP